MNQDRLYLQHIRDALQDIASYSSTGREAFLKDRMRQDAILRKLEVIGQAVKTCRNLQNLSSHRSPGSRSRACAIKSFTTISA